MRDNFKIYLISGKARHGKDTTGMFLKECYNNNGMRAITCSYASYLKEYAKNISNWDGNEETKPRELLQKLGNVIRIDLGKSDMLIERLNDDILIYSQFFDAVIVTDVRLKKEIFGVKKMYPNNTVTINVNRPNFDNGLTNAQQMHMTEIDLDDYDEFDYKLINTELSKLKEDVINIYKEGVSNEIYDK